MMCIRYGSHLVLLFLCSIFWVHQVTSDTGVLRSLYELDDWNECSARTDKPVRYCMARVVLSEESIRDVAGSFIPVDDRKHFRRTLLEWGVCLSATSESSSDSDLPGRNVELPSSWNRSDRYRLERHFYPATYLADPRTELAVQERVVAGLRTKLPGVQPYTEVEYCVQPVPREHYQSAVSVTLSIFVAILACYLCFKTRGSNTERSSRGTQARNSKANPKHQFLLFDIFKCYGLVGVVLAHCCLFGPFLMPLEDTSDLERVLTEPNVKLGQLAFPFLMLVFFTMSSMLLTVKLVAERRSSEQRGAPSRPTLAAIIVNRLIRLVPLNLLTLAFCALAYEQFVAGPLAPRQLIVEQTACRSHWWLNVLFLSNYNTQQPCLPHSWYVSADFQLFIVIATLLVASFRWPHRTPLIITGAIVCSFLGPFLTVLWNDFDPIGPLSLHEMRFFLLDSPFMERLYTPFYNNLCWSVGGMVAGLLYDRYRELSGRSGHATVCRTLNQFMAFTFFLLLVFIRLTIEASESSDGRLWLAACYALYKLTAAAFFSALFLRVSLTENDFPGSVVIKFGAKLYYCVYLIHFPIFRIMFSNETSIVHGSTELLVWMGLKVFFISYLLAIVLHLAVEKPAMDLLRRIIFRTK
uniref:Putative conserved plasma membrane protein n=2 Tax=Anopheles triannulatus TaxID=58253 RepID=A0A2M4ALG1_9DIPT